MRKTIVLGTVPGDRFGYKRYLSVELEVELREREWGTELSIMGSVWKPSRDDIVSGGQNHEEIAELFPRNPRVQRIIEVWRRWHLNGMEAGCEHQRAHAYARGRTPHECWSVGEHCPVCLYCFGHEWLHELLPADIIEEVMSW